MAMLHKYSALAEKEGVVHGAVRFLCVLGILPCVEPLSKQVLDGAQRNLDGCLYFAAGCGLLLLTPGGSWKLPGKGCQKQCPRKWTYKNFARSTHGACNSLRTFESLL